MRCETNRSADGIIWLVLPHEPKKNQLDLILPRYRWGDGPVAPKMVTF
jgi:hypothetical protein